ncbi:NADH-quinone oxidoreductase subunit L [Paenibacillus koleovorans]|uniref:NADH-quinone oxidoreductase subunit L n=1 Tax=Paenibacillus koleovorans TaxID=121608 RepID=UPI000FD9B41E|nr:NADH-quinone oxidoreductase subunit L [Paenibacillus koleovorans]
MESYSQIAWLIPLFPLVAFLVLMAFGRQWRELGPYVGIIATLASFILSLLVWIERLGDKADNYTWNALEWLKVGDVSIRMGFEINNLNALMLVIVSLVSLLVNVYSKGYMHGDDRITVFFGYVSLFTFAMLGVVISENLLELYIFWELVGLGSFLLIGFWYHKPEARAAAKKAFIMTRIGDLGLLIAILLLFWYIPSHSLDFTSIHNALSEQLIPDHIVTWVAILIFIGAIGKSGQFPLHTWLPDAMEGPTPISALIHAATMVAAGVYLVARTFDIFQASAVAMDVVAYVGAFTAILAATIGVAQNDIKRILAYSTVSQLGYMMLALGISSTITAGMFHLFTHAFFKALLFLGAGSIIHAVHTQNIHEMGGLAKKMKITTWTFAIGTLALSGIPPFSGFWSKDAILYEAYHGEHWGLFAIGLIAAFFTAFYMARLFFLVFLGKPRGTSEAHESPSVMTVPLVILAILALGAGFVQTPFNGWFGEWLTGTETAEHEGAGLVMIVSTIAGLLGIYLGYMMYLNNRISREIISGPAPWLHKLVQNKYYLDELYSAIIVKPLKALGSMLILFDEFIVDGIVRLSAAAVGGVGKVGSRVQNGQVQTYGLLTLLGLLILALALVGRRFI